MCTDQFPPSIESLWISNLPGSPANLPPHSPPSPPLVFAELDREQPGHPAVLQPLPGHRSDQVRCLDLSSRRAISDSTASDNRPEFECDPVSPPLPRPRVDAASHARRVFYFDRPPFQPCCCNNCQAGTPEIRVLDNGCMCCCQTICSDKVAVVATPNMPFPCCCCANAATKCDSCFGLCGPIAGNPKMISMNFMPGPNDAEKFVATAQGILGGFKERGAGSPPSAEAEVESEEMHRS